MAKNKAHQPMTTAQTDHSKHGYGPVNGLKMYYEIHYEIHGVGEPLVMLHGGMSTIGTFYRILPTLAKNRQIIAVEQQGHGHTADIDRPFSFDQMADDTATLLQQLGLIRPMFLVIVMGVWLL
jgi:pimeloyl-ACP methyl ester carboxylesterase